MDTIERKSLLYKTKVEYGDFTINHIQGCSHGCTYPCYAYMMSKRFGRCKTYEDWIKPKLVSNALDLLKQELPKYKDKINSVHLCFTSDPFMYNFPEVTDLSLNLIDYLYKNNIKVSALTKGILPNKLVKYTTGNFGITLVSLSESFRKIYEPGSSPYEERINSLYQLHKAGIKTWVSIEPYPTPNIISQDLNQILKRISFVDKIIFGRLNYNKYVKEYKDYKSFYNKLADDVVNFCIQNNIDYHIKTGTVSTLK